MAAPQQHGSFLRPVPRGALPPRAQRACPHCTAEQEGERRKHGPVHTSVGPGFRVLPSGWCHWWLEAAAAAPLARGERCPASPPSLLLLRGARPTPRVPGPRRAAWLESNRQPWLLLITCRELNTCWKNSSVCVWHVFLQRRLVLVGTRLAPERVWGPACCALPVLISMPR